MNTILIIDDDKNLLKSFEKMLMGEGYEVMTATSGEEGLSAVRESVPDLVISDLRLPGINGIEAFVAIREIEPGIPAIIMTAYSTPASAAEAIALGAFGYVLKPFDIQEMLDLIKSALGED